MKRFFFAGWYFKSLMIIFLMLTLPIPVLALVVGRRYDIFILFMIPEIPIIIWFLYMGFLRKIQIDAEGVKFLSPRKKYEFKWDEIKYIGVGECRSTRSVASFLYFSSEYVYSSDLIRHKIGDKFIMVGFQSRIVKEVSKYWKHRIEGLYGEKYKT